MKDGLAKILGKTISGVVVASKDREPKQQVFLTFTDGTYFEFWGEQFSCAGGVDDGGIEKAVSYAEGIGATVTNVYS